MTEGTHRTITTAGNIVLAVGLLLLALMLADAFSGPQMLPCDAACVEHFKQGNP